MLKLKVPEKPVSWNKIWECPHWAVRKRIQDEWASLLIPEIKILNIDTKKIRFPIRIDIYSYARRPLDTDNICEKPIVDAIKVALGIDDSIKYVRPIFKDSFKDKEDYTIIIIKDQDDR